MIILRRESITATEILETKASTILEFLGGLRGTLSVTFEEGTWAAGLYDLLKPHVANVVACNPRKNAALNQGNPRDKIDARELANRLRLFTVHEGVSFRLRATASRSRPPLPVQIVMDCAQPHPATASDLPLPQPQLKP